MIERVTNLFELIAIRLKPMAMPLGIMAVVIFVSAFFFMEAAPKKVMFPGILLMLWSGGLALLYHMYYPGPTYCNETANEGLSRIRGAHKAVQVYSGIFLIVWFVMLVFMTILLVKKMAS